MARQKVIRIWLNHLYRLVCLTSHRCPCAQMWITPFGACEDALLSKEPFLVIIRRLAHVNGPYPKWDAKHHTIWMTKQNHLSDSGRYFTPRRFQTSILPTWKSPGDSRPLFAHVKKSRRKSIIYCWPWKQFALIILLVEIIIQSMQNVRIHGFWYRNVR